MKSPLTNAEELFQKLDNEDLVILDTSTSSNQAGLQTAYPGIRIKGARHFDLKNDFSRPDSCFPNTLPSPQQFGEKSRALGISSSSEIVVYDNLGVYTSPRVWWMFKLMGHDNVSVLDGSLPEWISKKLPTQDDFTPVLKAGDFQSDFRQNMLADFDFIKQNLLTKDALVIDARSRERFHAEVPEPREGLRRGNIPGSVNIPFQEVLKNGKFRSKFELEQIFEELQKRPEKFVFSCGSGITACIVYLAGELVLDKEKSVYDGSWTEWATREN